MLNNPGAPQADNLIHKERLGLEAGASQRTGAAVRRGWFSFLVAGVVLLVAVAVLWIDAASFHALFPDGYAYSSLALNVLQGHGYVGPDLATPFTVRPIFPAVLAAAFTLLGPTEQAAVLAARLIFVALLGVVFLYGRRLFSAGAAVVAVLLILTAYRFNNWLTLVHLDYLTPLTQLLYLYLLYHAFEQALGWAAAENKRGGWRRRLGLPGLRSSALFAAAGVLLAVAFLVKETALLFAPAGIVWMLWRKELRTRRFAWLNLMQLGSFALVLLPWFAYIRLARGQEAVAVGRAAQSLPSLILQAHNPTGQTPMWQVAQSLFWDVVQAPASYYELHLQPNFVLAPLLVLALLVVLVQAVRGDKRAQYFTLCVAAFLPILLLQGMVGLRSRQSIYFFVLAFVALGQVAVLLPAWLLRRRRPALALAGTTLLAGGLVLLQMGYDTPQSTWSFISQYSQLYRVLSGRPPTEPVERRDAAMGRWIAENIPPGAHMMVRDAYTSILSFNSGARQPFFTTPVTVAQGLTYAPFAERRDDLVVFNLDAYGNHNVLDVLDTFLFAVGERELIDAIITNDIEYVVLTSDRDTGLIYYFLNHPDFVKVGVEDGPARDFYHVFQRQVDRPRLIGPPLALGDGFTSLFPLLKAEYPEIGAALLKANFEEMLGWSEQEIAQLEAGEHPALAATGRFSYENYADFVSAYGYDKEAWAAALAQNATDPAGAWPYVTMAYLPHGEAADSGQDAAAAQDLYAAFLRDPANTFVRDQLIRLYRQQGQGILPTGAMEALIRQQQSAALAVAATPEDLLKLAELYGLTNHQAGALDTCRQLVERWAGATEGYLCVAEQQLATGEMGEAVATWRQALAQTEVNSANLMQMLGDMEQLPANLEGMPALLAAVEERVAQEQEDRYALRLALSNYYLAQYSQQAEGPLQ